MFTSCLNLALMFSVIVFEMSNISALLVRTQIVRVAGTGEIVPWTLVSELGLGSSSFGIYN